MKLYDREGREITGERYGELKAPGSNYPRVADTFVRWSDGSRKEYDTWARVPQEEPDLAVEVSTVWLGIDHNFLGEGARGARPCAARAREACAVILIGVGCAMRISSSGRAHCTRVDGTAYHAPSPLL